MGTVRSRLRYGTFLSGAMRHWVKDDRMGWFVDSISYIVAFVGFARGVDLIRSPTSASDINYLLVAGFGQDWWGIALCGMSLYVFAATVNPHRHLLFYYTAHLLGLATYGPYAVILAWGFFMGGPPYTGLRFVTPAVGTTLVYLLLVRYLLRALPEQILGPRMRRSTDVKEADDE